MSSLSLRGAGLPVLALFLSWATCLPVANAADPPIVPALLPESTLAMLRIRNISEFSRMMSDTATGRMAKDPEIAPFLKHLYGSATQAFGEVEKEIGLSLDELRQIPQGEFCAALIDPGEGNEPQFAFFLDCGENIKDAEHLLDLLVERAARDGETVRVNKHRNHDVQTIGDARIVVKDGVIMMATRTELAHALLDHWDGLVDDAKTLAKKDSYVTIMKQCSGAKGERPHATLYVDPLGFVRMGTRGNLGALAVLALLEPLGVYGVKGVGGSLIVGVEDFESIAHGHLLLDDPRDGVLKLIAMKKGDTTPERWVPGNVASYATLYWDVRQSYTALANIIDTVRGEGTTGRMIQGGLDQRLGIDFQKDILRQLAGRVSMITWMEPPLRFNSESRLVAIQVNEPKDMRLLLDELSLKFVDSMMPASHLGTEYYRLPNGQGRRRNRNRNRNPEAQPAEQDPNRTPRQPPVEMRRPTPSIGVVGDYLLITDSELLMQEAIKTNRNGGGLAEDLEFKLVDGKIGRHLRGTEPGGLQFNRPHEALRGIYSTVRSPELMAQLKLGADQGNVAVKAFYEALTEHPLPPFEAIAKYLAPGGAMVADGPTGLHFTAFSLRRDPVAEEK
ncbi:MAG: hypothetical protein KDB14_12220 [Planctomycetales bacterium]|nr:hypothetical protein [Planctomycetales bacterium]